MRKQLRRRPEVEGLEAMTLLSSMGVAPQAIETIAKVRTLPNPLTLTGTVSGTVTIKGHGETIKASGKLSPFGKVSFSGPTTGFNVSGGVTNLTIPEKAGKLFMSLNLEPSGTSLSGTYTITGGTKALANETGTGDVTVVVTSVVSPIHFSATFSSRQTV
jgi:hypothetical protein